MFGVGSVWVFFVKTYYKCLILLAYFYQGFALWVVLSDGEWWWEFGGEGGIWGDWDNEIHCPRSSLVKGVTEMGHQSSGYNYLYFFTEADSPNKLCDQIPMLYLTNKKAGFGFLVRIFFLFLQLSSFSPIAFYCKEKTCSVMVWLFGGFLHCIFNFSSDTGLVFRPTHAHLIDATILSLRKRTNVKRKTSVRNSFPYWLSHCCSFLLSSRYQSNWWIWTCFLFGLVFWFAFYFPQE